MVKVSPTQDNKFVLLEEYVYNCIVIPKGYKTNGANVPRILYFFVPPFKPKYLPAVIIHDYLCDEEQYKLADTLFEEKLLEIENSITTRAMVASVKLYHRFKYGVK